MEYENRLLKDIGTRMYMIRKKLDLTQKDLCSRLNVCPGTISGVENGTTSPSFDIIYNLSLQYHVNIYYLLYGEEPMFHNETANHPLIDGINDEQSLFLQNFLHFFKNSELARFSFMSYFKRFILENKKLLKAELDETEITTQKIGLKIKNEI